MRNQRVVGYSTAALGSAGIAAQTQGFSQIPTNKWGMIAVAIEAAVTLLGFWFGSKKG